MVCWFYMSNPCGVISWQSQLNNYDFYYKIALANDFYYKNALDNDFYDKYMLKMFFYYKNALEIIL